MRLIFALFAATVLLLSHASAQTPEILCELPTVANPEGTTEALVARSVKESDIAEPADISTFMETNNVLVAGHLIGCENNTHYCYRDVEMPPALLDLDGGEIRVLLQHETDPHDQLRVINIHMGCEWTDDVFGDRGRYAGRYCFARQVGGGEYAFILGDPGAHNVFAPWGWFWITDYKLHEGNAVLGGNRIRLMSHPHLTARVLFYQ